MKSGKHQSSGSHDPVSKTGIPLKLLSRGSQGKLVAITQKALSEMGYDIADSKGVFGTSTELAVKSVQRVKNIDADGIVGIDTWKVLCISNPNFRSKVQCPNEDAGQWCDTGISETPTYGDLWREFGFFDLPGWSQLNIVKCDLSEVEEFYTHVYVGHLGKAHSAFDHGNWFGFICHRLVVNRFREAFVKIAQSGMSEKIITFDGCYNVRKMRENQQLWSTHSWGIAIDLNARWNPFGGISHGKGRIDNDIVKIFKDGGFYWGGNQLVRNTTHFQFCRLNGHHV